MSVAVRKVCQISGFLLLVSMLFVALSVGSYSASDPAWNHYVSHGAAVVQNLGGIMGAYVADVALFLLGSMVFLLVGMAVGTAWYLMRQHLRAALSIAWRGLVCLAAVSMTAQMLFASDPFFGPEVLAGGTVGQWLASMSVHYLNRVGTSLVIVAAVILALFVGVERQPLDAAGWRCLQSCGAWGWGLCQRLRQTLSGLQWPEPRRDPSSSTAWPPFGAEREDDADAEDDAEARWLSGVNAGESEPLSSPLPGDEPEIILPAALPTRRSARRRQRAPAALPSLDLLDAPPAARGDQQEEELAARARLLEQKLRDFGVDGEVAQVLPGPVITMYEYAPASGVKVSKIVNLQDDLALVMRALSVRVAPIPGKPVVGIEIPNAHRETVRLHDLLDSDVMRASDSKVSLALGKDILGRPVVTDLALIPHLLIAGATGSGKSVGLNSMICSLLFRATPAEVKLIMIDPKMLEFSMYEGIPHLLIPVVTNAKQAALALRRVVEEMERRYHLLAARGVRHIAQYNQVIAQEATQRSAPALSPEAEEKAAPVERLPYLVVVIDELSDLMMVSSREVEDALTRIAQMARAAGIHLIVATQRPSVDVLTGIIKANFPARISFQVTSKTDSRTILDANGAERLLGRGDLLFLGPGTSRLQRVHSAYVSEAEITRLVEAWKHLEQPHYDDRFLQPLEESVELEEQEYDEKYDEAVALVARTGQASISMLQRRLRVGYNRAARMIEVMEKEGVIGPADGIKPREVLVRNTFDEA
jgi:DNA segregation ATPase FtsK/SpoIIIE, S-DNA-T family